MTALEAIAEKNVVYKQYLYNDFFPCSNDVGMCERRWDMFADAGYVRRRSPEAGKERQRSARQLSVRRVRPGLCTPESSLLCSSHVNVTIVDNVMNGKMFGTFKDNQNENILQPSKITWSRIQNAASPSSPVGVCVTVRKDVCRLP